MVFSKYELECRATLSKDIKSICTRHGMVVYGSFFTGNFHLNTNANVTFSDLDLICESRFSEHTSEIVQNEILDTTGLAISVSIRGNRKHIDSLPTNVSRHLATVDTTLTFYDNDQITDEYFSYLISKFLLRTAYANIYFERNLVSSIKASRVLNNDPMFIAITKNKLRGGILSAKCIDGILNNRLIQEREILNGLKTLCQTSSISDIHAYWTRFIDSVNKYQLTELAYDISNKIDSVSKNPNKCFNSDSQTRRSLSLTLGLAAG